MIQVVADAPGRLHLVRGQAGQVEVNGRADKGFVGFALGADEARLRLSAVGAEGAEYLVIVPADVRVRVQLPGERGTRLFGTREARADYSWQPDRHTISPALATKAAPPPDRFQEVYGGVVPRVLTIPAGAHVAAVTVRFEGERFGISADRPLTVAPGRRDLVEVRIAGDPVQLVVDVPAGARDFRLRLAGEDALIIGEGRAVVLCTPVTEQRMEGGRQWFTFSPGAGRLRCAAAP